MSEVEPGMSNRSEVFNAPKKIHGVEIQVNDNRSNGDTTVDLKKFKRQLSEFYDLTEQGKGEDKEVQAIEHEWGKNFEHGTHEHAKLMEVLQQAEEIFIDAESAGDGTEVVLRIEYGNGMFKDEFHFHMNKEGELESSSAPE